MKRLGGLSTLAIIIAGTSGCGWLWGEEGYFRDRGSDYLEARQTAPIEVPAGVETRPMDPLLPIPSGIAEPRNTGGFEVPRPQKLQVTAQANDFTLQRSGEARWLVAMRTPAQAWVPVRQFFVDNGFQIAEERTEAGQFVTAWQQPADLDPQIARQLGGSNEEVRVRVRIEPGVQRNTTEVFVLSAQRPAGSSAEVAWSDGEETSPLDAALLEGLLTSLASGQEGASVSLLAERQFDAPNRILLSEDGSGNPVLRMDTDFNRAWSSVGRALELADIRVEDLNRSLGIYYINLAEGARRPDEERGFFGGLFSSEPDPEELEARAERYQVRVTDAGEDIHVSVDRNIDTVAPSDVSRRILSLIQESLR